MIQAVYPQATLDPPITRAGGNPAARKWTREEAVTELVRGRLQGLGPVTVRDLSRVAGFDAS